MCRLFLVVKMKHKNILYIFIVLSLIAVTFFVFQNNPDSQNIKIGALLILTGTGAEWGQHSVQGIDLAVEEINARGGGLGKQLQIVYEDNPNDDGNSALTSLNKLIQDDVQIVVGTTWSGSGLATAPAACENKLLMISPTLGVAGFNEECDYIFNLWPHDKYINEQYGAYIYQQGYNKIAIIGSQQIWEKEQADAIKKGFEEAGGEVVIFENGLPNQKDFRTDVLKIKSSEAEAIAITRNFGVSLLSKDIKKAGLELPIYTAHLDASYLVEAEGSLEGAYSSNAFLPTEEFKTKFQGIYGVEPEIGADSSYDTIMFIAQAIESTQSTDPTVLKDYMNAVEVFEGASGKLIFDDKGGVDKTGYVTVAKGDQLVFLENIQ